ncbi:hypothetical protein [Rathayibacter iranicus]|uniref:Uncharacterized protein n=1 Tax=Rathayibacter iranicus NCPPB 2253 = VKM Ac-1602 TaxID=1328868 RepID=A0ABX5LHV6_9MICO|nr:hypothetical protein [Rathayibacter iranicus]MWV30323.1 hypothetical protein [Rathayibacter iranicus NCPPB 2253 = VKM Ac-1602]PWJ65512.1 hypothetical protein B0H03_103361 [Rathayibacter iranicus NCPPB 2253 = VKM Ac-1602]
MRAFALIGAAVILTTGAFSFAVPAWAEKYPRLGPSERVMTLAKDLAASEEPLAPGTVELQVKEVSTFAVKLHVRTAAGTSLVRLADGSVAFSDGASITDSLPRHIDVADGPSVDGDWTIDTDGSLTFSLRPSDPIQPNNTATARSDVHVLSDWGSQEWGHCVSGNGVGGAVIGGFGGTLVGPAGTVIGATGGLLGGIIQGAFSC